MGAMIDRVDKIPHHAMKRTSVTAQLVAYWGFVPESVESIYSHVDQIVIAYGRVKSARKIDDGTLKRIKALPDPDGKIILEAREEWEHKTQMRRWCASKAEGNRMLILDGDEIWIYLDKWLKSGVMYGQPRWVNLWHDQKHWIYDPGNTGRRTRWGRLIKPFGSNCPHYRYSFWKSSYWFRHHTEIIDANETNLNNHTIVPTKKIPQCMIYHLGHALPKKLMKVKHQFYINRDKGTHDKCADCWHTWKGQLGKIFDGVVDNVHWKLPQIVERAFVGMKKWKIL